MQLQTCFLLPERPLCRAVIFFPSKAATRPARLRIYCCIGRPIRARENGSGQFFLSWFATCRLVDAEADSVLGRTRVHVPVLKLSLGAEIVGCHVWAEWKVT
jgi:hypothetical protein